MGSLATREQSAADEWRMHWGLVLAAMLGTSFVAIPSIVLGNFMQPLQDAFGWSRAEISGGMTVFALVGTPLAPFAGALADRFGSRKVAVPGLALNAMAFAAFGLVSGHLWFWLLLWVAYTLTGLLIRSMVWNRAVSKAFTVSRGLALAVLMSGTALGQIAAPVIAQGLIGEFGWRVAFMSLGLGWGGLAFVLAIFLFRETPEKADNSSEWQGERRTAVGGLTLGQAIRDTRMHRLGLAVIFQSVIVVGFTVHLFPMLTGANVAPMVAANIVSLVGVASLTGQFATGWLADRTSSWLLPTLCYLVPGFGYALLLLSPGPGPLMWLAVFLVGYAAGASVNITVYLTTRYVGLRHFGKIFGLISSCMGLGAGLGPIFAGSIFDVTGSYDQFLTVAAVAAVIAALLVSRLGPYEDYSVELYDAEAAD